MALVNGKVMGVLEVEILVNLDILVLVMDVMELVQIKILEESQVHKIVT